MERGIWAGGARGRSTQQNLSAYFVARSVKLYLHIGGRFGFVMPRAALSRQTYSGFRTGNYTSVGASTFVAFDQSWDLLDVEPQPFPVPAGVTFGERASAAVPMGTDVLAYGGHTPDRGDRVEGLTKAVRTIVVSGDENGPSSPYRQRFRRGATLAPRMLALVVDDERQGTLGVPIGRRSVRSRKTTLDKLPWRDLPVHRGVVESIFVRPTYLGESVLPFRTYPPLEAVIPYDGTRLLDGGDERIDRYPGLAESWRGAELIWSANRSSELRTLVEQVNYLRQLSVQFPVAPLRVIYTKAGSTLTAAYITDSAAIIDTSLYWATVTNLEEARYLVAILKFPAITRLVRPMQAVGGHFGPDTSIPMCGNYRSLPSTQMTIDIVDWHRSRHLPS